MKKVPSIIGLVLCEQVVVEEHTRNVTLVKAFSQRELESAPPVTFPFVVYAILTNGMGEMFLEVVIERLDTLDEVYRQGVNFRFTSPLQDLRCLFRIRDCSFPIVGDYQITLLANGELVALRTVRLTQKESSS